MQLLPERSLCLLVSLALTQPLIAQTNSAATASPVQDGQQSTPADDDLFRLNEEVTRTLSAQLKAFPELREEDPDAVDRYSRRGDLHMFLGHFAEAEADYKKMVQLAPNLDASHWRLGIAMCFAGHPEEAAAQFDKYHLFDNVDRENGIWRYLSHHAAFGREKAQEQLLKYEKDDRPPFREVYRLFDGSLSPDQVLQSIGNELPEPTRKSRLFYAHLYIGLNFAAEGEKEKALLSLREAVLNEWPRGAGFGPDYMWHVGRLQYLKLQAPPQTEATP